VHSDALALGSFTLPLLAEYLEELGSKEAYKKFLSVTGSTQRGSPQRLVMEANES